MKRMHNHIAGVPTLVGIVVLTLASSNILVVRSSSVGDLKPDQVLETNLVVPEKARKA